MQSVTRPKPIDISYWTSMETIERGLTGKTHQQIELERAQSKKEYEEAELENAKKLQDVRDKILSNQLYSGPISPAAPQKKSPDERSRLFAQLESSEDITSTPQSNADFKKIASAPSSRTKNGFDAAADFNDSLSFLTCLPPYKSYCDFLKDKKIEDTAAVFRAILDSDIQTILNSRVSMNIPVGDFEVHFMCFRHDSRITNGRIEVKLIRQATSSTIHISRDLEQLKKELRADIRQMFNSQSKHIHPAIANLYNDFCTTTQRHSLNDDK